MNHRFCPHCGMISGGAFPRSKENPCLYCGWTTDYEINPDWNINDTKWLEMHKAVDYGEITKEEFNKQWEEYCQSFFEQVIKKRSEFDQKLHDGIPAWEQEREERSKRIDRQLAAAKTLKSTPTITCPTCHSTNTEKISVASKAVGAGLFGLFSKTARSQFRCKNCGYKW